MSSPNRPWIISSFVLALLTVLTLFDARIIISFRQPGSSTHPVTTSFAPVSTSSAVAATTSAVVAQAPAQPSNIPPIPKIDFVKELGIPAYDKSGGQKKSITDILQTKVAIDLSSSFIPKEGSKTPYGLTIGLPTFEDMKKWLKSVNLTGADADRAERLMDNIYHPCCGAQINPKSCGCGHAYGLSGLVKKMVQEGKSDQEIYAESTIWLKYFFPRHFVILALFEKKIGGDMNLIDYSQKFSSIDAEKPVTDYLTYTWDGNLQ